MIDQRKATNEPGLPLTACAPDLFTRFDQLKPTDATVKGFPVRFYMGFTEPLPSIATVRPDSWLGKLLQGIAGNPKDFPNGRPNWVVVILYYFVRLVMWWFWLLGYQADLLVKAKALLKGAKNLQLQEVSADIASKEIQGKWTGTDVTWTTAIDKLARKYYAPTDTIDAGEAVSAYLAGVIDDRAAHDYARMQGRCDVATDAAIETQQSRLGAGELVQLWQRGGIDDSTFRDRMRELGWINNLWVEWQQDLSRWWPDQATVIDWGRRGIKDNQRVAALRLDADKAEVLTDDAMRLLRGNGVGQDDAMRLLRATYRAPDPATAAGWYRRTIAGMYPEGVKFTGDDLDIAISASSTAPAYRELVRESIWQPISARLLRTAYDEGVVDEQAVMRALVVEGYAPEDAQTVLREWAQLKPAYTARKVGLPAVGRLVSLYADALIGSGEFAAGVTRLGLSAAEGAEALAGAQWERTVAHRKEMLGAVKASYLGGAIDDATMQAVLNSVLADSANAADVAGLWRAELEVRPRPDAAAELGQSYQAGRISEGEYVASLTQLRYTPEQIARILYAADAVAWGKRLKDADLLVKGAQSSLTAQHKLWAGEIAQAEKLAGKVEQRTRTSAGKLMGWIKSRVAKAPKKVSEKGPANGQHYAESTAALAEAQAFVDGKNGGASPPGAGIAAVAVPPAAPAAATAVTPEPGSG